VETTANAAPSTGRRRLVKGAMLATPAVMTLMSGRLAAASSTYACAIKLANNNINPTTYPDLDWKIIGGTDEDPIYATYEVNGVPQPLTHSCYNSFPVGGDV
jgi:hypothetical protein